MFEFQIVQTKSGGEITKIKVIDLDELYNFVLLTFPFEIIYCPKILFEVLEF